MRNYTLHGEMIQPVVQDHENGVVCGGNALLGRVGRLYAVDALDAVQDNTAFIRGHMQRYGA